LISLYLSPLALIPVPSPLALSLSKGHPLAQRL